MLHILILILKIIGIIIAVILGILLLLIAIFLFVPVHYEVQGRCDGDLDSLKGKVQVTWLLQICMDKKRKYRSRKETEKGTDAAETS